MQQPKGDSAIQQSDHVQRERIISFENIPNKTRLPQSEMNEEVPLQTVQAPQQQLNPLQMRLQLQQQLYDKVNQQQHHSSISIEDSRSVPTCVYAVPSKPYGRQSQILCCQNCKKAVMTEVELKAGWGSCFCGMLLFFSFLILCFFLPCCMRDCKDAHHYCRNCAHKIGRYNFICD